MTLVHLIRHGRPLSGWGEPGGEADPGLSPEGLTDAEEAARALSALPVEERPGRILTSPLRRCRETAAPFARLLGAEAVVAPAVAEIPTPDGINGPERVPWLRKAMGGAWAEIEGLDGEAWRGRVATAVLEAGGAAIFTHFVAINAAVSIATGSSSVLAFRPAPGSITTLRIEGDGLRLVSLGRDLEDAGRVL